MDITADTTFTRDDIQRILEYHNIRKGSRSHRDYESGKYYLMYYLSLEPEDYQRAIRWLAEWVGV